MPSLMSSKTPRPRRFIALSVAVAHLLLTLLGGLSPAHAQTPDGEPPTIDVERLDKGIRGDSQVFSATVTDDVEVARVTLHYRLGTEAPYDTVPMDALIGTDIFTATIETGGTDETVLQYYIEARDPAGNRSIQGFAFDPIERALTEPGAGIATAEPAPEPPATGLSTQRKILYGVLGVVAVGALAAAAGGGGGSDSPRGDDPGDDAPLDIFVDPL